MDTYHQTSQLGHLTKICHDQTPQRQNTTTKNTTMTISKKYPLGIYGLVNLNQLI